MSKGSRARALARGQCPNCGRPLYLNLHTCEQCRVKQADRDSYRHRGNRIRVERDPKPSAIIDPGPNIWDLLEDVDPGLEMTIREAEEDLAS